MNRQKIKVYFIKPSLLFQQVKMTGYLFVVSLIIQPLSLFSQNSESDNILQAKQAIFSLDTIMAGMLLDRELRQNPGNGYVYYYRNYLDFTHTLLSGDREEYKRYSKNINTRLHILRGHDPKNPEYLYFLSAINLQTALLGFFNGDYWVGATTFYRAHRQIHENTSIYPDFSRNHLILGIMEVLLSSIPDDRAWLFHVLGMNGDREAGLEKLRAYYTGCKPGDRIEALIIFVMASNYFSTDRSSAFNVLSNVHIDQPGSPLYQYIYALSARRAGQPDEALRILKKYNSEPDSYRIPFADLLMGELLLPSREEGADMFFKRFINGYQGTNLKKTACLKLSWYYYLRRNNSLYREYRNRVRSEGSTILEQDKQALAEAEDTSGLNYPLLMARILFDGNQYADALSLLLEVRDNDLKTAGDRIEYFYRLARVYHGMGDLDEAEKYYHIVLEGRGECPCYFIPYSAMQLAEINENEGDFAAAEKYYSECLELNRYQYKNTIGSRARAGLKRIADHSNE